MFNIKVSSKFRNILKVLLINFLVLLINWLSIGCSWGIILLILIFGNCFFSWFGNWFLSIFN